MTRYAISGARSAVKIFLFPVAKRAGTVHGIYKPVKAKNACDSSDQQVLYTCLSGKKDRGESSPRPTYTNLLHSRFNPVHVYAYTFARGADAAETPRRQRIQRVSWTVYWTSNTSCLARLAYVAQRARGFDRTRVITSDKASP